MKRCWPIGLIEKHGSVELVQTLSCAKCGMAVVSMNCLGSGTQTKNGFCHTDVTVVVMSSQLSKFKHSLKEMVFTQYSVKSVGKGQTVNQNLLGVSLAILHL